MTPTNKQIELLVKYLALFWDRHKQQVQGDTPIKQIYLDSVEKRCRDPLGLNNPRFHRIRLEFLDIHEGYPIAHFDKSGNIYAVQLRPITKKKLLLGCGNNPTTICYHEPHNINEWSQCCYECFSNNRPWATMLINQKKHETIIGEDHYHKEYDTMDPMIEMNPTIVGFFGEDKHSYLLDNSFDTLLMEGITLENTKYFDEEYKRLTSRERRNCDNLHLE